MIYLIFKGYIFYVYIISQSKHISPFFDVFAIFTIFRKWQIYTNLGIIKIINNNINYKENNYIDKFKDKKIFLNLIIKLVG